MPLDDISNHINKLSHDRKPTVKRRRLDPRITKLKLSQRHRNTEDRNMIFTSHVLGGASNLKQHSNDLYNKIQNSRSPKETSFGKHGVEASSRLSNRLAIKMNQNNSVSLQDLRNQYEHVKARYLIMENAIIEAKANHEEQIIITNETHLTQKETLSVCFNDRLRLIEDEYFERAQIAVEKQNNKYNERIIALNTEIAALEENVNYASKFDFTTRLAELKSAHDEKMSQMKTELKVKCATIKSEKDNCQSKKDNINTLISMHKMHKTNVLTIKLHKSQNELERICQSEKLIGKELASITYKIEILKAKLKQKKEQSILLINEGEHLKNEKSNYEIMLKDENAIRRVIHNEFQDLKGSIRVFCRLKPVKREFAFETSIDNVLQTANGKERLIVTEPIKQKSKSYSPNKQNTYKFYFDTIFDTQANNSDIFVEVSQLIQSVLDGYNVCIFTYGQTGSGKTFTMSNVNDGLIPKSLNQIFSTIESYSKSGWQFEVYGQFFEIYGDDVRDLLSPYSSQNANDIHHVSKVKLSCINKATMLLSIANNKRSTAYTTCNNASSRSHSIFRIMVQGINENKSRIEGVLNLVDLAGSERIAQSHVTGIRLKETLAINKSLSALGDVITALYNKSNHVPYRNSRLTYLLKDSLSGSSKTLMLVNISCLKDHFSESLNSLRFASKVNSTKL